MSNKTFSNLSDGSLKLSPFLLCRRTLWVYYMMAYNYTGEVIQMCQVTYVKVVSLVVR